MTDVGKEMADILDQYTDDVKQAAKKAIERVAKETAQKLKDTSPSRNGGGKHYKNGWRVTKENEHTITVHNALKPRLTHLLENGHAIANQHGRTGGRVPAQPHIKDAEDWAAAEVSRVITEEVNKA